ncbi:MAG: hypothetical protein NZ822_01560 [Patescibacteria group bacterium]|nr:hypothetical protein [Patescibacteria group bacterium]
MWRKFFTKEKRYVVIMFALLISTTVYSCGLRGYLIYSSIEDVESSSIPVIYYKDPKLLLDGQFGVITKNWSITALYPVYRSLTKGKSLSHPEKVALFHYYLDNFNGLYFPDRLKRIYGEKKFGLDEWVETRDFFIKTKLPNYSVPRDIYDQISRYNLNCLSHAFFMAARTLRQRAKIYTPQELEIWLRNQDEVFRWCNYDSYGYNNIQRVSKKQDDNINMLSANIVSLTDLVESLFNFKKKKQDKSNIDYLDTRNIFSNKSSGPIANFRTPNAKLLKYDFEYQEGAKFFYQGNFSMAREIWSKIVNTPGHPWRGYAALGIGRTYIREMLREGYSAYYLFYLPKDDAQFLERKQKVEKIAQYFEKILRDNSFKEIHPAAKELYDLVIYRLNPRQRIYDSVKVLEFSNNPPEIVRNLDDFAGISFFLKEPPKDMDSSYFLSREEILSSNSDFLQWIYLLKISNHPDNFKFAFNKFQQTQSLHWLLASILNFTTTTTTTTTSERHVFLEILEKIPTSSPLFLTAKYYWLKALLEEGRNEKVRSELARILNEVEFSHDPFSEKYFRKLMVEVVNTFEEVIKYGVEKSFLCLDFYNNMLSECHFLTIKDKGKDNPIIVDGQMLRFINTQLPVDVLLELATSENLSSLKILSTNLKISAFVRSILLNDFEKADKIAKLILSDHQARYPYLIEYLEGKNYDEKNFYAVMFMLRNPSVRPFIFNNALTSHLLRHDNFEDYQFAERERYLFDNELNMGYRGKWWCRGFIDSTNSKDKDYVNSWLKFFTVEQLVKGRQEFLSISNFIPQNYFLQTVISYAKKYPQDSKVPEALHRAIYSVRDGECKDKLTTSLSKEAFKILHSKYGNTQWAEDTPYYF